MLTPPDTERAYREIRRMVVSAAAVLLLLGAATGVFLEKVRRDTVARQAAAAETFVAMMKRIETANTSYAKIQADNNLLGLENESLRAAVDSTLREHEIAMDRMKGLSARLSVFGAVVAKNIETVKMPGDLRDAPASTSEAPSPALRATSPVGGGNIEKLAEFERKLELSRRASMYAMKYAESLAAGSKSDPLYRQATLESALNAMGVTEQQYRTLGSN